MGDFMKDLGMEHAGLVKLHEAYLCRKYLTLIMECADGATLLDYVCGRHTLNEDVVASYIKQLCEVLEHLHQKNAVHPTFDSTHPTSSSWSTTPHANSSPTRKPELWLTCWETPSSALQRCCHMSLSHQDLICGLLP